MAMTSQSHSQKTPFRVASFWKNPPNRHRSNPARYLAGAVLRI
jgi:hypothetical protein